MSEGTQGSPDADQAHPAESHDPIQFPQTLVLHVNNISVGRETHRVDGGDGTYTTERAHNFLVDPHGHPGRYAISTVWFLSGHPDLILHDGVARTSPHLASTVTTIGIADVCILLPPIREGRPQTKETVSVPPAKPEKNRVYRFEIEVPSNGSQDVVREKFEWRKGSGGYSKDLGNGKGWELVRMSGIQGGGLVTRDGKEVVGACKRMRFHIRGGDRNFGFLCLGSGQTELGSRWAIMAFMSSLCIFQHRYA